MAWTMAADFEKTFVALAALVLATIMKASGLSITPMTEETFQFTQSSYNASIHENAVGKTYVIPTMKMGIYLSDPAFNVRYKVVSGDDNDLFKADERLIGDFCFLRLRLRTGAHSVINREQKNRFVLSIKARGDYGHNSNKLTSVTEVVISVIDENDLSPIFFERNYEKQVPENTHLHASIMQVQASDADVGVNGEIYFSFAEKTDVFTIHPTNGIVYLTRLFTSAPDKSTYELEVLAKDRGPALWGYHRASRANFKVEVVKVNFYSPEIRLQELPSVIEHGEVDSVYAILYVHDKDIGLNGEINIPEIIEGNEQGYFRLAPGKNELEYNIEVAHTLDREANPEGFNLTIKAADKGSPPKTTTEVIHVKLQDTNDQSPRFEVNQYNITIEECVPVHTPLIFVGASDSDFAKNAEIRYKIKSGNGDNWFRINPANGLISVRNPLDAEKMTNALLTITAEDQANMGSRRNSQTAINIIIEDCNDNAPVFIHETPLEVEVEEAKPVGSEVFQVEAYDLDSGENGFLHYSIANVESTPFNIDHFTGKITTKEVLDYEYMQRIYHLNIRASDMGSPFRRESELLLTVRLRDVNDNKPRFEKVNCKGHLSKDAPIGTSLVVVPAIDFEVTNIISYSIVSGNEDNCFDIVSSNGELRTNCQFFRTNNIPYSIGITATDGTNTADPTYVTLTIVNSRNRNLNTGYVSLTCDETDVSQELTRLLSKAAENNLASVPDPDQGTTSRFMENAHSPRFPSSLPSSILVTEGRPVGDVILPFQAEDDDQGYNGRLAYTISSGNTGDVFRLDTYTGDLVVLSEIDRESRNEYTINITVYDMGSPVKSAYKLLNIRIEDVNDNAPLFEKDLYEVTVREDRAVNSTILQVIATDNDEGDNALVSYSILTDTKDFVINPNTGKITVATGLDRERQGLYNLKVQAVDRATDNPLSSFTQVTIRLDDINDNSPEFPQERYEVRAREDLPVGTVVVTIQARDRDIGANGEVRYTLLSGMDDKFEIDRITGTVRIVKELDFESKQIYNITARAKDRGDDSQSTRCIITIEVVDVNENLYPPTFADFVFQGRVKENEPVNTIVMQLIAMDYDQKKNDLASPKDYDIVYSIRNGSGLGLFIIDRRGNIRTTEVLDRETQPYYWLTIFAQDRGTVPLSSMVEVFIEVEDENDNVPQTIEPVYYPAVMENSPEGTSVVKLEAYDLDDSRNNRLSYEITSGNPQGFFKIDRITGLITTTQRKLDRESQEEHILEVNCSDSGVPKQSSTTRVVITVIDDNDNPPHFTEYIYKVRVPERPANSYEMPLYRVVAYDEDKGLNGGITYSLESEDLAGLDRFTIHPQTGLIMSKKEFLTGQSFDITVIAEDSGHPKQMSSATVRFSVVSTPNASPSPPLTPPGGEDSVMENDVIGHMVSLITATDPDGDKLWYAITGGNEGDVFSIDPEDGNIILAGHLDWETRSEYNLTIQVSDSVHYVYTWVKIRVLDINDNRPQFEQALYKVDIGENTPKGTEILTIKAHDKDEDKRLFYTIHSSVEKSSINKFRINSETDRADSSQWTGVITTLESLDREVMARHELTVMVRDQGHPSKRSFARVMINIIDHNDHSPVFLSQEFEGRVFETAALGTAVVQVLAADRDTGKNAEIKYSILYGNIAGAFAIDPTLGTITVATYLDKISQTSEYNLVVKATDGGSPSLSSTATVKIFVTVSDNAPPRFTKSEYTTELRENQLENTQVTTVTAKSRSSVVYDIVRGDDKGYFSVVPNSGVIASVFPVDFETVDFFNLTLRATNMAGSPADCTVLVHIVDENDHQPVFMEELFEGSISEEATPGSVILDSDNTPLVVKATDNDTDLNAQLVYSIIETEAQEVFDIDTSTGAIKTKTNIDHETAIMYEFTVHVTDSGSPRQSADVPAKVRVHILDVNDSPPEFPQNVFVTTLLLSNFQHMDFPAYKDVQVITVAATDPDLEVNSPLSYEIISGNDQKHFAIDPHTGTITVATVGSILDYYELMVRVSDGKYQSQARVKISVDLTPDDGLAFSQEDYYAEIQENTTGVKQVAVVQAVGHQLNEHLVFSILNPSDMFQIGATSGVVQTTGKAFDRELQDNFTLTVEVEDQQTPPRVAHAVLHVQILDTNDNRPVFVNQPYYAIVSIEADVGEVIKKVSAIDRDIGANGRVLYRLLDDGDGKFAIDDTSGAISVRKKLQFEDQNKQYKLIVGATDQGEVPLRSEAEVPLTIRNEATPIFSELYYSVSVPESVPIHSAVQTIEAQSPKGRKLVYAITEGDLYGEFGVQFETDMDVLGPCSIIVQEELDYEYMKSYNLTVTATDFKTGAYSSTIVHIALEDVNDNPPSFHSLTYINTISEAVPIGTSIVTVTATDADTGHNAKIHYHLQPIEKGNSDSNYFHIDSEKGIILTKMKLDREVASTLKFQVVATDSGFPALSSTVTVKVIVTDLNDNPPKFEQPAYHVTITDLASRGQFVTKVIASDPDTSDADQLAYSIVGGNVKQTFSIEERSGIISLSSLRKPDLQASYALNISVTDGVFTNFARVLIYVEYSNNHVPTFPENVRDVDVVENAAAGEFVAKVIATDNDTGKYGEVMYFIESEDAKEVFRIEKDTGKIYTEKPLDRESASLYHVPVKAVDGGGRAGHLMVRVNVADQGDHKPQFIMSEYKANVYAALPVGEVVLEVQAQDHDLAFNGDLDYAIYGGETTQAAEYFDIESKTGKVTLSKTVVGHENQLFQFFVRAQDGGSPPQHSDVPVDVYIMGAEDYPPRFPYFTDSEIPNFFANEDQLVGSVVATVMAESNETLVYSIVPGEMPQANNPAKFTIDNDGKISILEPLDRETIERFELTIKAATKTSPPLVAFTRVTIQVRDKNDNSPKFESNPYIVSIVENTEIGSKVVQVMAHDADIGANADITYEFSVEDSRYANTFSINSESGWISTLVDLDREKQDSYSFSIVAKDRGSEVRLSDMTSVNIQVMDHNDEAPVFSEAHYDPSVNEDALPGTIICMVTTVDLDLPPNDQVTYSILEGDPLGQFNIRDTGEIYVNKVLDREVTDVYQLTIAATDGAFVTTADVTMTILDANDNTPVCTQHVYQKTVSENQPPGYILRVVATDADEAGTRNARMHYSLSGDRDGVFFIDENRGILTTLSNLDRERTPRYHLVVKAEDGGGLYCTSDVYITVRDENDNAPEFSESVYTVQVSESAEVNALLVRVAATDVDTGIHRKVQYTLGDGEERFKIDSLSGLVSLNRPLDREQQASYNVTVYAYDMGTPRMTSSATLFILVLDINDNPPEFERSVYSVTVTEALAIGSHPVTVYATSRDTGINAEISYHILHGNEQGNFQVEEKTGAVSIVKPLDYESLREFVITIEARDGGTPSLSSSTIVKINVTDANDNAPMFSQDVYQEMLKEDIQVNSLVVQVLASDQDSPEFSVLSYHIGDGDPHNQFDINPEDGYIYVIAPLDRESIASYELEIEAVDSGNPSMTGTTTVSIELLDINDTPPRFMESNYTAVLQVNDEGKPRIIPGENKELGYNIIKLEVTDDDLVPNGGPFTFDIVSGNDQNKFHIDAGGVLSTAATFNRLIKDTYELVVRVFDNGMPPLYSDISVVVQLVEESAFPPQIEQLSVAVSAYNDEFPGGVLGKVQARDPDPYDEISYSVSSDNQHLFDIDSEDGTLKALQSLDAGKYNVTVSVTDGKFVTLSNVTVTVNNIDPEIAQNAVVLRIDALTPEDFIDTHLESFTLSISSELEVKSNYVHVLSLQPASKTKQSVARRKRSSNSDLDVLVAVQKSPTKYLNSKKLRKQLDRAQEGLERAVGIEILEIRSDVCKKDSCENGECVTMVEFYPGQVITVVTDEGSFVYPQHDLVASCNCQPGYSGPDCKPPICNANLCQAPRTCVPQGTGYRCECPMGTIGEDCRSVPGMPLDDATSFRGTSYVSWQLTVPMERRLSLSLDVRTEQSNARLMHARGLVDYSFLELEDGMVQYRFDCGSGEGLARVNKIKVDDGKWHSIVVQRVGGTVTIVIDEKYHSNEGRLPGTNDVLNLDSNEVFFGAEVEILPNGYESVMRGFVGCMREIKVEGEELKVSGGMSVAVLKDMKDIDFGCHLLGICANNPCANSGRCVPLSEEAYSCICPSPRFQGAHCEYDLKPCDSLPCLNGGTCENRPPNNYRCYCEPPNKGQNCEQNCDPNPCKHGASCTSGPNGPICACPPGYSGLSCEADIDECRQQDSPCKNNGRCQNTFGGFICNCTTGTSGMFCETITLPDITSSKLGINQDEILIIAAVIIGVIVIVAIFVTVIYCRRRKKRNRNRENHCFAADMAETEFIENNFPCKVKNIDDSPMHANNIAMSNMNHNSAHNRYSPLPPPVPKRPASYTASAADSMNTLNMDTFRSPYSSTGDELENALRETIEIPEFLTNVDPEKKPRTRQNHEQEPLLKHNINPHNLNFAENYPNDLKKQNKYIPSDADSSHTTPLLGAHGTISSGLQASEDDLAGYHWDTSDWMPEASPAPLLTEVPIKEVLDDSPRSSQHSNDSNLHVDQEDYEYNTDYPDEYIENDGNESEYVGDSEYAENELDGIDTDDPDADYPEPPNFQEILALQGQLRFDGDPGAAPRGKYEKHPNMYLPQYNISENNSQAGEEADPADAEEYDDFNGNYSADNFARDDEDDVIYYGFPRADQPKKMVPQDLAGNRYNIDFDHPSTSLRDDMSVSMGGYTSTNASMSDISEYIENSEANNTDDDDEEHLKVLLKPGSDNAVHTDV